MRSAGLVSVIMPVYRGERFVAMAIESVLAQTYRSFELVIVNDGSPDGSAGVISRYLPHPQIRYLEQPNGGVAAARNAGLAAANGEFIALLDQDDVWLPTKLERQVPHLKEHSEIALCHTRVECIDAGGSPCSCVGAIGVLPLSGLCAGRLLLGNGIAPLTVVIRASCIDEVGGFNQRFAPADDWELWLRIARRYPLHFIDETTAWYRVHDEMVSRDLCRMQQTVLSIIDSICERFPDVANSVRTGELASARARSLKLVAEALDRSGDSTRARGYWKAAYRTRRDIDALLALLGLSTVWRRRVLLRGTRLRSLAAWYRYKLASNAARFWMRPGSGGSG